MKRYKGRILGNLQEKRIVGYNFLLDFFEFLSIRVKDGHYKARCPRCKEHKLKWYDYDSRGGTEASRVECIGCGEVSYTGDAIIGDKID